MRRAVLACALLAGACSEPEYTADQYFRRGVMMMERADVEQARKDFDKALALDPKFEEAYRHRAALHFGRALASKKREDFVAAVEDFTKAIELKNYNPNAYFFRGEAFKEVGQAADALADYDLACSMRSAAACSRAKTLRATSSP